MSGVRHIACCVDGSPASRGALAEAAALAGLLDARLSVLHVAVPPLTLPGSWDEPAKEDFFTAARHRVESFVQGFPDATPVAVFGLGSPPTLACGWAVRNDVDLLVVAAHSGPLARFAAGGFTSHLLYHAPCSVLVTRTRAMCAQAS